MSTNKEILVQVHTERGDRTVERVNGKIYLVSENDSAETEKIEINVNSLSSLRKVHDFVYDALREYYSGSDEVFHYAHEKLSNLLLPEWMPLLDKEIDEMNKKYFEPLPAGYIQLDKPVHSHFILGGMRRVKYRPCYDSLGHEQETFADYYLLRHDLDTVRTLEEEMQAHIHEAFEAKKEAVERIASKRRSFSSIPRLCCIGLESVTGLHIFIDANRLAYGPFLAEIKQTKKRPRFIQYSYYSQGCDFQTL